jgi:hypothetical protein
MSTAADVALAKGQHYLDEVAAGRAPGSRAPQTEPDPLRRPLPPADPYPTEALGEVLASAARAIGEVVQAPDAIIGASLLAAASLAAQAHADVVVDGRRYPLSLWHLSIAESGERKTAVDELALSAHRTDERHRAKTYESERRDYDIARKAHEAVERAHTKGKDAAAIRVQLRGETPPEPPLVPWLTTREPTIEGVHRVLVEGRGYGGLFSDDGGDFLGGWAMAKEQRMRSAAALSALWDRGEFDRVRGGDGASKHWGRRLALHLMVQPVVAETVLSDDLLTGQGFLARCLLSWPASRAGTRRYVERDLSTDPALAAYWERIRALLEHSPALAAGARNELAPRALRLTAEAKGLWIRIADGSEAQMGERGAFSGVRAWASKGAEQVLRVAGVLTLLADPDATEIGRDAIERAGEIVSWHLGEAARIVGTASVPAAIRHAEAILEWARERKVSVTHSRELLRNGPNCIRSADVMREAMAVLVRHGWADPLDPGTEVDGAPRRAAWRLRV